MKTLLLVVVGIVWLCHVGGESIDVVEGQNVTLKCRFHNPNSARQVSVYWMHDDSNSKNNVAIGNQAFDVDYTVVYDRNTGTYDLNILRAQYSRDNGVFECWAKESGTGQVLHTTSFNLTVLIRPGPPRITPSAPAAIEGQHVNLTCSSGGGSPDPDIIWYRADTNEKLKSILTPGGGRDFPTKSTLTLTPEKEDDGAKYQCVVWSRALPPFDSLGIRERQSLEAYVSLNVNYFPRITIGPENPLKVELNHPATLSCTVDAKPPVPNITWVRRGRPVSLDPNFRLDKVTLDDAGTYECRANNQLGHPVSASINLDVLYGPTVTVQPFREANEGEDISVMCNVTANPGPITIEWLKESDNTFKHDGDILYLRRASATDHGDYICRAVNLLSPAGGEQINRVGNATVAVRIKHPPGKAYITPADPIAVKGEKTTLTCRADPPGWPVPSYHWWRDDPSRNVMISGDYTILHASASDEGKYHCKPKNSFGEGLEAVAVVRVFEAPRILEGLHENAIHPNGIPNFELSCRAEGKPEPSVFWYKNDKLITLSDGLFDIKVDPTPLGSDDSHTVLSRLIFKGPNRINSNQLMPQDRGVYKCSFKNEIRDVYSTQLLRIEHAPITVHKQNKVAYNLGEVAELECRMQSYPVPSFVWSKGPNFINPDGHHFQTNNTALDNDVYASVLTIRGIKDQDYGEYTCKGTNTKGDHKTIIKLLKKGPPEAPYNVKPVTVGTDFITAKFDEAFNGGDKDTKFLIEVSSPEGVRWQTDCQRKNPCMVDNLNQFTSYGIKVKAYNRYGNSSFSDELYITTNVDVEDIPSPEQVFFEKLGRIVSFRVQDVPISLEGQVEVQYAGSSDWMTLPSAVQLEGENGEMIIENDIPETIRVRLCTAGNSEHCGPFSLAQKVDVLPTRASTAKSMQYMIAIIIGCLAFIGILVLVFICCVYRQQKTKKLKKKTASMETAHRNISQQPPPPSYFTVGLENKGMNGSLGHGLDDAVKPTSMYGQQHYQGYNGQIPHQVNDSGYDVSGIPDPYAEHHDQNTDMSSDIKPQISFDESLESDYSSPNSRNRRIIREIIV